ncbi:glycosyltransferase family 1 protein [Clostridium sulfidigenes]|uniref:glycosyltransferase family 1 protein n=1 Tax=Clostridium sulfidigenes TaxID=318464 RepID=UPI003F8C1CAF
MKNCIVYYPFKIDPNHPSASNIRPVKFIKGLKEAGYNVEVIQGYAKERKKSIKLIKKNISKGKNYDFLYMENSTEPTLLTEKHHLPIHPIFDFKFLSYCKKKDIKVGLFYRDIHWRFDQYKNSVSLPKRLVAYSFYYYDLIKFKKYIDILYLPSHEMKKHIPINLSKKVIELPSGCDSEFMGNQNVSSLPLKLLYVGGLSKSLYNIETLVEAVYKNESFELYICCRPNEWVKNKPYYEKYLTSNRIHVIHKNGKELDLFAESSDLLSLAIEPSPYWEFAMPMKLFSYISYGKPILGVNNTVCGRFIEDANIGYVSEYNLKDIGEMLSYIEKNYDIEYNNKLKALKKTHELNTWKMRANTVICSLE